ncbi:hypothetical protein DOTSEDRAFT_71656 [Dothistroma septosporum NZE10]|uniref:Uncharacterized protein n=1 Tax=Dothistroma septosporum (strain NZE10 / CBS 128990) TaxID=675120 RepID=N1PNF4_DOTSN|nr:hypothetical protein DOTSEDRAFT_71656 [Dothistroma septosporum NZE10]
MHMKETMQAFSFSGMTRTSSDNALIFSHANLSHYRLQLVRPSIHLTVVDLNGAVLSQVCESLRSDSDSATVLRSYQRERVYVLPGVRLKLMVTTRSSPTIDMMTVSFVVEHMPFEEQDNSGLRSGPMITHPQNLNDGIDSTSTLSQPMSS